LLVAADYDYDTGLVDISLSDEEVIEQVKQAFGEEGYNPADYLLLYYEEEDEAQQVKEATATAYDRVGETAHI